jgi:hypothetical protein
MANRDLRAFHVYPVCLIWARRFSEPFRRRLLAKALTGVHFSLLQISTKSWSLTRQWIDFFRFQLKHSAESRPSLLSWRF